MPTLITYKGRPVKRRCRVGPHLRLAMYHPLIGIVGERLTISQEDWQQHGCITFFSRDQMPDVRVLAAKTTSSDIAQHPNLTQES